MCLLLFHPDLLVTSHTDVTSAIAFGYFEALLKLGDHGKFLEEETRLRSLANMLTAAGFTTWQWEDFADVTFDLIRLTAQSVGSPTAEADLLRAFNDELEDRGIQSDAIIAHLKVSRYPLSQARPQHANLARCSRLHT